VHATLEWLWNAVAAPVLDHLGHDAPPPPGRPWPRVWWCPTGPLTLLPLHAAGYHDLDDEPAGRTVLDRVVSSYTPTLDALIRTRQPPAGHTATTQRLLLVAMPHTPASPGVDRLPDLPGVDAEARVVEQFLHDQHAPAPTVRIGHQATQEAILADLPGHAYVHFACHGGQRLDQPSASALYLHNGPLTVVDVARLRLAHAELAFLSACQTAIGGIELLDESIHLAAALQLAGYRHVIGTLWTIADQPSPEITHNVYRKLARPAGGNTGTRFDLTDTAHALHAAVRRLREDYPGKPMIWAPYLHFGP
jgi:CHAT domain-containing protein